MVLREILAGGTAKLVESVGTILDSLFTSKEEKEQAKLAMMQVTLAAQATRDQMLSDLEQAYLADAANLREQVKLEVQSEDWFVRRARPALGWLFLVILVWNYVALPVVQMVAGTSAVDLRPLELPSELWAMCGVWFVGYGILRSWDKTKTPGAAPAGTIIRPPA